MGGLLFLDGFDALLVTGFVIFDYVDFDLPSIIILIVDLLPGILENILEILSAQQTNHKN